LLATDADVGWNAHSIIVDYLLRSSSAMQGLTVVLMYTTDANLGCPQKAKQLLLF
jgi:hypothetical protein